MRWDDFTRVGSPTICGTAARGLSVGQDSFPEALSIALAHAGVHAEEVADLPDLEELLRDRKPDFLICTAAALGPDPESVMDRLLERKVTGSCPAFLVCEGRLSPENVLPTTRFSELLGSGQDALGYFLMIRATLRRKRPHVMTEVLEFGGLSLDQEKFALSFGKAAGPLNMLEFCVLGAMLDAPRMVWNKVFLNRVVFGPIDLKPGRQFDTYMSRVRRGVRGKIGTDPIVAERGMGYALSPSILGASAVAGRESA